MPPIIISRPTSFAKGADHTIKISRDAISSIPKVMADSYFQDVTRWKAIVFNFKSIGHNEIEVVKFKADTSEPEAIFSVSYRAANSFYLKSIVIHDFDGDILTVDNAEMPADDTSLSFTVDFPIEILVNPTLSSSIEGETISLSWTPLSTIPDYQIWKKTGSGQFIKILDHHNTNSFVDYDVVGNETYEYYVVLDFDEDLYTSNTTTQVTVSPIAPTLSHIIDNSQAILNWTASSGATEYRVYKKVGASGTYGIRMATSNLSYTDSQVSPGTISTYKVRAFAGFGSPDSNEITVAPVGSPVISYGNLAKAKVSVTRNTVAGAENHTLFYKRSSDTSYTQIELTNTTTTLQLSGETSYDFYVKASNTYGYSSNSNVVTLITTEVGWEAYSSGYRFARSATIKDGRVISMAADTGGYGYTDNYGATWTSIVPDGWLGSAFDMITKAANRIIGWGSGQSSFSENRGQTSSTDASTTSVGTSSWSGRRAWTEIEGINWYSFADNGLDGNNATKTVGIGMVYNGTTQQWTKWISASADGKNWIHNNYGVLPNSTDGNTSILIIRDVCYSHSLSTWVCVGSATNSLMDTTGGGYCTGTSTDGENWSFKSLSASYPRTFMSVASGGDGRVVAINGLIGKGIHTLNPNDPTSWTQFSLPANPEAGVGGYWERIAFGGGKWIMVGKNSAARSSDGINWTVSAEVPAGDWNKILWTGDRFMVFSTSGTTNNLMISF